jgi:hypothetical protein
MEFSCRGTGHAGLLSRFYFAASRISTIGARPDFTATIYTIRCEFRSRRNYWIRAARAESPRGVARRRDTVRCLFFPWDISTVRNQLKQAANQPLERNDAIRHARCCAPVAPAAVVAHL